MQQNAIKLYKRNYHKGFDIYTLNQTQPSYQKSLKLRLQKKKDERKRKRCSFENSQSLTKSLWWSVKWLLKWLHKQKKSQLFHFYLGIVLVCFWVYRAALVLTWQFWLWKCFYTCGLRERERERERERGGNW